MIEDITSAPVFAVGIGWSKATADRPYFNDQLTLESADNITVTVRIDQVPPPTKYE